MSITILIPTYRRPNDLYRCLTALQRQTRPADEVLVVVRDSDRETWEFFKTFEVKSLPLKVLTIKVSGVIAAMNLGFETATGDIISITDDDAAPHPDWLERIEAHFTLDKHLGGLGGRDRIYINGTLQDASTHPGASNVVGQLQWFGRMIGNHHVGTGQSREVDLLKGVNMSFRREAIVGLRCDERLKGAGAQVHFEVALSLATKQRNWKLVYDPDVTVDHYIGKRFDEDKRNEFNSLAQRNAVHNETLILLDYLSPMQRIVFLIWSVLIGTRAALGFTQLIRFAPIEGKLAVQKWIASMQGRWLGWITWQQSIHH